MRRKGAGIGDKEPYTSTKESEHDEDQRKPDRKNAESKGRRKVTTNPYQGNDVSSREKTISKRIFYLTVSCLIFAAWVLVSQSRIISPTAPRIILLPEVGKMPRQMRSQLQEIRPIHHDMAILFPNLDQSPNNLGWGLFYAPQNMNENSDFVYLAKKKDYGGLEDLRFPDEDGQPRAIWHTQSDREGFSSSDDSEDDDYYPLYYAFDVSLCDRIIHFGLQWHVKSLLTLPFSSFRM
jgi:hypothetical protein